MPIIVFVIAIAIISPKFFKWGVAVPLFGSVFGFASWVLALFWIDNNIHVGSFYILGSLQGFSLWILGGIAATGVIAAVSGDK